MSTVGQITISRAPLLVLALLVGSAGCHAVSQYVSPSVRGRVVDGLTGQPINNVQVRRAPDKPRSSQPLKGAEQLRTPAPVLSEADGSFVVDSQRALAFLRRLHWSSATLSFTCRGYEPLTRTFLNTDVTNTPAGEPLVEAGDIPLKPLPPKPSRVQ